MFKFETPIKIKYDKGPVENHVQFWMPCFSDDRDWTNILDVPTFMNVKEILQLEFGTDNYEKDPEGYAMVDSNNWPKKLKKQYRKWQEVSLELSMIIIGHSDPKYLYSSFHKAVEDAVDNGNEDATPFDYIPVELNGEDSNLTNFLFKMDLPVLAFESQLQVIVDTTNTWYSCGDKERTKRAIDIVKEASVEQMLRERRN